MGRHVCLSQGRCSFLHVLVCTLLGSCWRRVCWQPRTQVHFGRMFLLFTTSAQQSTHCGASSDVHTDWSLNVKSLPPRPRVDPRRTHHLFAEHISVIFPGERSAGCNNHQPHHSHNHNALHQSPLQEQETSPSLQSSRLVKKMGAANSNVINQTPLETLPVVTFNNADTVYKYFSNNYLIV
jgi:hypothetical protein